MNPNLHESIREALQTGNCPGVGEVTSKEPDTNYAANRFCGAWRHNEKFGLDEAVLLRQLVRWSPQSELSLDSVHPSIQPFLKRVGLRSAAGRLVAEAFTPKWLGEIFVSCDEPPVFRAREESFPAEAYLQYLDLTSWRSSAQKNAVWEVLTLGPGQTKTIVLPTGAGKSLCFQALPLFSDGLTLVIVPTIALAMDQQQRAAEMLRNFPGANPIYYSSDSDSSALDFVRNRRTRMVFSSPEAAVSGRLRPLLDRAAEEGWFQTLVIDECHLIETWGAQFRVEFQALAGIRARWERLGEGRLRTILLSATMSLECQELLTELFAGTQGGSRYVCQRYRPEIQHFNTIVPSKSAQKDAILDCVLHLPRPAIVYVTEIDEAIALENYLRIDIGFSRVGCFHGDTLPVKRKELLAAWKNDRIDLMIANSAFGVGVDKPDVRSIVHACWPENLDRYYQEIGRAGRDGWSSNCLLVATQKDRKVAQGLRVRLLKPDSMQERWRSLYHAAEHVEGHIYRLPLNSRRLKLLGTRTYSENVRWNKRLLLQLHRAKCVSLRNLTLKESSVTDEWEEYAEIELHIPPDSNVGELIADFRNAELDRFSVGQEQIEKVLERARCFARSVQRIYSFSSTQRACGGCPTCRSQNLPPEPCPPLESPESEPAGNDSVMVSNAPDPISSPAVFTQLVDTLVSEYRITRFYVGTKYFERLTKTLNAAFSGTVPRLYRLDPFDPDRAAQLPAKDRFILFHVREMTHLAVVSCSGRSVVHLRCGFATAEDADGRDLQVVGNARLFHSPEAWLRSLR